MATQTEQIAASKQRDLVPAVWQLEFQSWSDDALLSLNEEELASPEVRSYAGWEFDYRIAFGKTSLPEKKQALIDRSRWTLAGAQAEIRRRMEEQE